MPPQIIQLEHSESSKSLSSKHEGESTSDPSQSHTHARSDGSTSNGSFVREDTRIVNRTKAIVYICLLLASIAISVAAFFFVKKSEESVFEAEFRDLAGEIIELSETNAANTVGQVRSLATAISSHASTSKMAGAWPNVTLPYFTQQVQEAVRLTGSELFAFIPVVPLEQRESFEAYTATEWPKHNEGQIPKNIHNVQGEVMSDRDGQDLTFVPVWQVAPQANDLDIMLLDMDTFSWFHQLEQDVLEVKHVVMSGIVDVEYLLEATRQQELSEWHPRSIILEAVQKTLDDDNLTHTDPGGFVFAVLPWEKYFKNVLPYDIHGFIVEVNDHCGTIVTYRVDGHVATVVGEGNLHDTKYNYLHLEANFAGFAQYDGADTSVEHCYYTIDVYPTDELKDKYMTYDPYLFALAILGVFLFTTGIFFCYDCAVERRQRNISRVAKRTTDIVKSLFPKNVQERIMAEAKHEAEMAEKGMGKGTFRISMKDRLKETLSSSDTGDRNESVHRNMPPIADLFPSTTIMFADLVGFTAWSSMREPAQVFQLLETIYSEFDSIAKRRRIFKVETVGDCYVAACGLPDPRRDHAVAMARFARDCRACMMSLMNELEVTLGPDTGELGLRVGLHSGPVTGGVLRGEKARFQLFGDTMNTTARIETTGKKNMIHISEETANILQAFGKGHWTKLREDKVNAKGKGELTTYWLVKDDGPRSTSSGVSSSEGDEGRNRDDATALFSKVAPTKNTSLSEKAQRLVKWNAEVLLKILKDVVQRRQALNSAPNFEAVRLLEEVTHVGHVFGEVTEILALPTFDAEAAARQEKLAPVVLEEKVTQQLEKYVHAIATLYRNNAFHNFEHVSHVTMSVTKLFSRIVAPEVSGDIRTLHDHTYGITSEPLTQFAAAFAALIHDVDHQGVTNATLIEEQSPIAAVYHNKSVAEQNSVDIAWSLLMDEAFIDLRNCIYTTPAEYNRFRQLIVNLVMATDIMDKSLSQTRKDRWAKAFTENNSSENAIMFPGEIEEQINRKATIVLEHVIQASDVSHTMQHWHIYRKWNARLFEEMMTAYRQGRTHRNPADVWYEGEIGFFDFYIIPLAKKLKECGVFGVSSDEYLNYAETNRKEWEAKGRQVVAEMVARLDAPVLE